MPTVHSLPDKGSMPIGYVTNGMICMPAGWCTGPAGPVPGVTTETRIVGSGKRESCFQRQHLNQRRKDMPELTVTEKEHWKDRIGQRILQLREERENLRGLLLANSAAPQIRSFATRRSEPFAALRRLAAFAS